MTMDAQRMHALACLYARERTEERLAEAFAVENGRFLAEFCVPLAKK